MKIFPRNMKIKECPICESKKLREFLENSKFIKYICEDCGTEIVAPKNERTK